MTGQSAPVPQLLADLDWCLAQADQADPADQAKTGAVWRLSEPARQLDANLVRLPANHTVDVHQEPDVDVLLLPVAGFGTLDTDNGRLPLTAHALMWLPRGSRRSLTAGAEGLAYLTVHQKRAGLRIRMPEDPEARRLLEAREEVKEGGESACMLPRLCPKCGAPGEAAVNRTCSNCGAAVAR